MLRKLNHTGFSLFLLLMLSLMAAPAFALDLDTALSKGLAGEVDDGYLAVPPGASNEAQGLIGSVNQKRKAAYAEIATKNGVTTEVAGKVTFEKRYPGFPAGTWVRMQGVWARKSR